MPTAARQWFRRQLFFCQLKHAGRLVGQRPVVQSTGQRFGLNMISAISPEGKLRFKVLEHSIGSEEVIGFLEALLRQSARPIMVLLDRNSIHHSGGHAPICPSAAPAAQGFQPADLQPGVQSGRRGLE